MLGVAREWEPIPISNRKGPYHMNRQQWDEIGFDQQLEYVYGAIRKANKHFQSFENLCKSFDERISAIEATQDTPPSGAAGVEVMASVVPILARSNISAQYPGFTARSHLGAFEKHCSVLGGAPSDEKLLVTLDKVGPWPLKVRDFAQRLPCTHKTANAWLYLFRKKNWVSYDEITWTYSYNEKYTAPGSEANPAL